MCISNRFEKTVINQKRINVGRCFFESLYKCVFYVLFLQLYGNSVGKGEKQCFLHC